MKKIQILGLSAAAAAAAAVLPFFLQKKITQREKTPYEIPNTPIAKDRITDYKDKDHLIFCPETQLNRRFLKLEKSINFRDIGGYTGLGGRKTRWGRIIRSEELAHLSDNDVHTLESMNIRHVYDFRGADKARLVKDKVPRTAEYQNLPILQGINISAGDIDFNDPDAINRYMKAIYSWQVKNRASEYAVVLHAMTDEKEYPILYHCTNGKDRTGFMTALILLICGVPESTIISDYTLTNLTFDEAFKTLGTLMAENMKNSEKNAKISKSKLRDFFGVRPEWLKIQLDYIRNHYKNVDDYLMQNTDLTKNDLDAIRNNMLEG